MFILTPVDVCLHRLKSDFLSIVILLRAVWNAQRLVPGERGILLINELFEQLALGIHNANIVYQLIAALINRRELPKNCVISALEKQLLYAGCEGIEDIPSTDVETVFRECLKAALKNGELPKATNLEDLVVSLMMVLSGTLLATKFAHNKGIAYHFHRQLKILWQGVGVKTAREA